MCKDFKTPPRPLNTSEQELMFPERHAKTTSSGLFVQTSSILDSIHKELYEQPQKKQKYNRY